MINSWAFLFSLFLDIRNLFYIVLVSFFSCSSPVEQTEHQTSNTPFIVVLGNAQDAGYPQAGCSKECCNNYYSGKEKKHFVSCIVLIDPQTKQRWMFDCTPDFPAQLHLLDSIFPSEKTLDGIFLTHAHMGHYTGLMYLGREAINTKNIPVYCMPDMQEFLQTSNPWQQLVSIGNIDLIPMKPDTAVQLTKNISVTPFCVPHRDEISETVGYKITAGERSVIFIPDIDKWERWETDILELIPHNDLFFLDGTFFKDGEIPGRNMSEIPHPFIEETMSLFDKLSSRDRAKIHFIHLNHTNPALMENSGAQKEIEAKGFKVALQNAVYSF